jgi:hypothetical protein
MTAESGVVASPPVKVIGPVLVGDSMQDSTDSVGQLLLSVMEMAAEFESDLRRRRFWRVFRSSLSLSGGIRSPGGVHYFADELFEDVFEGNQSAGLAVLVDQASKV